MVVCSNICDFLNSQTILNLWRLQWLHTTFIHLPSSIVLGVKRQASARGGQTAAPEVGPESNPVTEMLRMESRCLKMVDADIER